MKQIDVSVNVTAHLEGILLHKTLRSIWAGIKHAQAKGVIIELNISLDNADSETREIVEQFCVLHSDLKPNVYRVNLKDLGLSRNYLIEHSQGKYIVFFDGDDFFTENYIYRAYKLAESNDHPAVYSPTYMINFEGDHYLIPKIDSNSELFNPVNLFETNYFISQNFVHAKIYEGIKYESNSPGYGMEDWHWNTRVIAAGYMFYNVPQTIFFYRRKKIGGLLSAQVQNKAVLRQSTLFLPENFSKYKTAVKLANIQEPQRLRSPAFKKALGQVKDRLRKRHIIYHYAQVQYTLHKNVYRAVRHTISDTFAKNKVVEDMTTLRPRIPNRLSDIGIDEETVHYWGLINQYEPMIRASRDMLGLVPILEYPTTSLISELYLSFCKKYVSNRIDDILMVPHLERGGADLAAIHLIKELSQNNNVLIITTIDTDSPWLSKVKSLKNVICLESKVDFAGVNEDQRIGFILKIIQHWGVKRLSIVNSEVGYKIVTRHNQALRDVGCKIYLHTYAFDMTNDGYLFNFIPNGLVDAYKGVDLYVTDSAAYKKELEGINGFAPEKVISLYLPISSEIKPKTEYDVKRKILWASRVHESKLVEVAVEIGKLLQPHGIELHMFGAMGSEYEENDKFYSMIKPYDNIIYHGNYDGFMSLNTNDYDMFVMTTKNEGMPNVILEAMMANIFIIAPSVGGIPECINTGVNGILVKNKFDPESYLKGILVAYQNKSFLKHEAINKHNRTVLKLHSITSYRKELRRMFDNR